MDPIERAESEAQACCNIIKQKMFTGESIPCEYFHLTARYCEKVATLYEVVAIETVSPAHAVMARFWHQCGEDWREYDG